MTKYSDMELSRINAAHEKYHTLIISDPRAAKKINDAQWAMVANKSADMDAAFVLTVENQS